MAELESSEIDQSKVQELPESNNGHEINRLSSEDTRDVSMKMERVREAYMGSTYSRIEHKPTRRELWPWYAYELCTYFVHTALIPIIFSLIISHMHNSRPETLLGVTKNARGLICQNKEIELYQKLTNRSISIGNSKVSPLEWTSISWAIGLILVCPALRFISVELDHGLNQQAIAGAATAIGSAFCLPFGFFKAKWIFPLYIAPIVVAITVATASHTRHHGLMVRGFTGPNLQKHQFSVRRGVSSWLSLYATAAGCLGSALIASFVYYMLRIPDTYNGLWVVSIFSGLLWLTGIVHVITLRPGATVSSPVRKGHFRSVFKYRHGLGSLVVIGLSSFASMCIFTGAILFLVGELCLKPAFMLYCWLIYFIFPSISLPLLQPIQHVLNTNAVKMHMLGLILSLVTSATGFQLRDENWRRNHILLFAALQSTSAGLLHAFGRVLVMDCSPAGKEGAFATWFSLVKMAGTFGGFAVASGAAAGNIGTSFGFAFGTSAVAMVIAIYGNISDVGGAVAAGLISEGGASVSSPATTHGLDNSYSISYGDENENEKTKKEQVGEEAA